MAKKLYPLRFVPDDEIEEMRILLREHGIEFHETSSGFFGIGTAAIWVNDAAQLDTAKALIAAYQNQRYTHAHQVYLMRKAADEHTKFLDLFQRNPGKVSVYLLFAFFLIFLTTLPFWL